MLEACVRVLADWSWDVRPAAIVQIPSRSYPILIDSVGRWLSQRGRLPHLGSLSPIGDGPAGASGGNSAFRLAKVWDQFTVGPELAEGLSAHAGKPILLVDDRADSRWTITVAGRALRQHGASAVLPFVLAAVG